MTPILPHKEFKIDQEDRADRHLLRDLSLSPERSGPSLFVMGNRKPFCFDQEQPVKSSASPRKGDKVREEYHNLHQRCMRKFDYKFFVKSARLCNVFFLKLLLLSNYSMKMINIEF